MNKLNRLKMIINERKKNVVEDIRASCPVCKTQKPTGKMQKSKVDGKHYCTKKCMDEANKGQKQVSRLRELAGL